jgi:preprotein translocase subunit SecF
MASSVSKLRAVRLPAFVLSAALAAALLAGCGSTTSNNAGDFQGDKKSIAQVVDDLQKAAKGRPDTKEICNTIFAKAVAQKLQQGSDDCQDAVTRQLKDASDFDISVKTITVNGTTATASVVSKVNGNDATQTLQFVKDGSAWRISGIGS